MSATPTDEVFMHLALDEAAAALAGGDEPYGAVIVHKGASITGRNQCVTANDPTAHSEVMAIRNAAIKWGIRDLSGTTMYTSFEPCPMCCGAIMLSGIRALVIGARPVTPEAAIGNYTVERLLDLAGQRTQFEVRRDVLTDEALAFYARLSRA
jgi:tRNA(adenine34) deaminase